MSDPDCDETCEDPRPSLCDGDTSNNEWFVNGVCMLDQMSKAQIVYSLEHNPVARQDLPRVTTCHELLELLQNVPLLSTVQEDDAAQQRFNQQTPIPFYSLFRGNCNNR
jgi:hypothetical protein